MLLEFWFVFSFLITWLYVNSLILVQYFFFKFHNFFSVARQPPPSGPEPPHNRVFTITLRQNPLFRAPLYEWSARRTDLYLTTRNIRRHTSPRWDSNPHSQQASCLRPTDLDLAAPGTDAKIPSTIISYDTVTESNDAMGEGNVSVISIKYYRVYLSPLNNMAVDRFSCVGEVW